MLLFVSIHSLSKIYGYTVIASWEGTDEKIRLARLDGSLGINRSRVVNSLCYLLVVVVFISTI